MILKKISSPTPEPNDCKNCGDMFMGCCTGSCKPYKSTEEPISEYKPRYVRKSTPERRTRRIFRRHFTRRG